MWEAFHGRALAYEAPLAGGDQSALAVALQRNVWRGAAGVEEQALSLARVALRQDLHLSGQGPDQFSAGKVSFLTAREALGAAL
jgi:cytochrome b pre-mRNA-processing protein 3